MLGMNRMKVHFARVPQVINETAAVTASFISDASKGRQLRYLASEDAVRCPIFFFFTASSWLYSRFTPGELWCSGKVVRWWVMIYEITFLEKKKTTISFDIVNCLPLFLNFIFLLSLSFCLTYILIKHRVYFVLLLVILVMTASMIRWWFDDDDIKCL